MWFRDSVPRRIVLNDVTLLLICSLAILTACEGPFFSSAALGNAGPDKSNAILAGVVVVVLFIGIIALAVSDTDVEQEKGSSNRDCLVSNEVQISFEMFVDGRSAGLIEPDEERQLTLGPGSHELLWYPVDQQIAGGFARQVLEIGDEPGYYNLILQPQPAGLRLTLAPPQSPALASTLWPR